MEDEIDLRKYVQVLLRWRWWIAGLALLAAVAALAVSFLLPPSYEAKALVAITQPRYIMQFDPRFEAATDILPVYKAYPELATGDELLGDLLAGLNPLPEGVETLDDLRDLLEAALGADPSVVRMTARAGDPMEAARVANDWAELFVDRANEIYGGQNGEQVRFFEGQLAEAQGKLEAAEGALVAFQARNQGSSLNAKLGSARQEQAEYLAEQRETVRLSQDIGGLRAQLATRQGGATATLGDELSVLRLRTRALDSAGAGAQGLSDIQLQVGEQGTLSGRTVEELVALLDALQDGLEGKAEEVTARLEALEPQILALQQQVQEVDNEADRLVRTRDVTRDTYLILTRKVEEARIAAQDTEREVRLASRAAAPEKPVSPRKKLNTLVGGALGLMMGVVGAFALEWWRQEASPSSGEQA